MNKRFLVLETPDSWELYWSDENGRSSKCVARVYDKETLNLLVQAPALLQLSRIAMNRSEQRGQYLMPRDYKPSVFGRFQTLMYHFLKK